MRGLMLFYKGFGEESDLHSSSKQHQSGSHPDLGEKPHFRGQELLQRRCASRVLTKLFNQRKVEHTNYKS